MGLIGSFGLTACSGPVVAATLGLATGREGAAGAPILLAIYCLGATGPFLLFTLASQGLRRRFEAFGHRRVLLTRLGGLSVTGLGLWLVWVNIPV